MDEIKQRLKEATDACITKFEAWRGKTTDNAAREGLQEAVHELRKVAARIEIELAVSDRKQQGSEPIPIPAHRASRRPGGDIDMDDDNRGQGGNRPQQGNRGDRDNRGNQGARPVQIRKSESAEGPQPGNDAAGDEGGERKTRPLSLKRTGGDE